MLMMVNDNILQYPVVVSYQEPSWTPADDLSKRTPEQVRTELKTRVPKYNPEYNDYLKT